MTLGDPSNCRRNPASKREIRFCEKKKETIDLTLALECERVSLDFAAPENLVLFAAWALRAAQAAGEQHRNPDGHDQGQQASARHEPLN